MVGEHGGDEQVSLGTNGDRRTISRTGGATRMIGSLVCRRLSLEPPNLPLDLRAARPDLGALVLQMRACWGHYGSSAQVEACLLLTP